MDFDDLEDVEAAAGPSLEQRRLELVERAAPERQEFPAPVQCNFGKGQTLKLLVLHEAGEDKAEGERIFRNVFQHSPMFAHLTASVFEAPFKVGPQWLAEFQNGRQSGFAYFDRLPFAGCQWESWHMLEQSINELRWHFERQGPYDGVVGFGMGGEVLLRIATLAQEGEPGFQRMFRFMLLFSSGSPRHFSPIPRPKWPLQVPTVISWSEQNEFVPRSAFEESALFFAPEVREVVLHCFGHAPPAFTRWHESELERITRFLRAMWSQTAWEPSAHPENARFQDLWLPFVRAEAPLAGASGGHRRFLLVPDPADVSKQLPESGATGVQARAAEPFVLPGRRSAGSGARMDAQVSALTGEDFQDAAPGGISVETLAYSPQQRRHDWHGKLQMADVIGAEHAEKFARHWADSLMEQVAIANGDSVALVGLGTGAFLALAIAKMLIRDRRFLPAGLWLVNAPTCLPWETTAQPAALIDCPVRYLTHANSVAGPPWCWEVATCGPFSQGVFRNVEHLVNMVLTEFDGAPAEEPGDFAQLLQLDLPAPPVEVVPPTSVLCDAVLEHVERLPLASDGSSESGKEDEEQSSPLTRIDAVLLGARALDARVRNNVNNNSNRGGTRAIAALAPARAPKRKPVGTWRTAAVDRGMMVHGEQDAGAPSQALQAVKDDSAGDSKVEGTSARFEIRGEVLVMTIPRAPMTPCEIAEIWEREWGCRFAGRLKFASPAVSRGKWLHPRDDHVPLDDVVPVDGPGAVLDAVAAALRRCGAEGLVPQGTSGALEAGQ